MSDTILCSYCRQYVPTDRVHSCYDAYAVVCEERDTLRSEREHVSSQLWDAEQTIAGLRARMAAAERDAARYVFVRDGLVTIQYHIPFGQDGMECRVQKMFGNREAHKPTLDEAIDALATPTTTEDV